MKQRFREETNTHTNRKRDDKNSSVKLRGQRAEARKSLGQRKDCHGKREKRVAHLQKLRQKIDRKMMARK